MTKYVENASKLLPRPIGQQLVGVASLLDPSQFTSTPVPSETTTFVPITPSPRVKTNSSSTPNSSKQNETQAETATPSPRVAEAVKLGEVAQKPASTSTFSSTSTAADTTDEEDGEVSEEDFDSKRRTLYRSKRQSFDLPGTGLHPMKLLDGLEIFWKNFGKTNETSPGIKRKVPGGRNGT